jgi:hypothetical protein
VKEDNNIINNNQKSFSKGKGKGNVLKNKSPQEAAGHNSEPAKQTYYCGSECHFK